MAASVPQNCLKMSLPWVASESSNVGAYKSHYSALENFHFPPYLLGGHLPLVVTDGLITTA